MKRLEKYWLAGLLSLLIGTVQAQEDCKEEPNYSVSNFNFGGGATGYMVNDDRRIQLSFGQNSAGSTGSGIQGISAETGIWGHYRLEPQAPIAYASQGEYVDRIEVEWEIIDGYYGPPITGTITKVYRNGRLLTTVPIEQTAYVDYNVFPGEFYTYQIVSTNNLGESWPLEAVGFMQPNGRVTGKIETRTGAPVVDTKVTLSPNLGRSLKLDGIDDYVFFTDQDYSLNDYYTLEGWWRNVTIQEQTLMVAVDSGTTDVVAKVFLDAGGYLHFFHDGNADGTGLDLVSDEAFNLTAFDREWHHFAAVYDTTNIYLYVDGDRVAEVSSSDPMTVEKVEIELGKDGPDVNTGYYSGHLDDFRIWQVGRTRAEIRKYKDITLTGEEAYLQSYWKFDEQYSDKIFDFADNPVPEREHGYICGVERSDFISPVELGAYSDNGGDYLIKGVYYGSGTTFSASPSKETAIGNALQFDGIDDFISFDTKRIQVDNGLTIEGWFKTGTDGKDMVIFQLTDAETDQLISQIWVGSDNNLRAVGQHYLDPTQLASTSTVTDERWYHYALTVGVDGSKLYLNGELISSNSTIWSGNHDSRIVIGRSNPKAGETGTQYFEGLLDEIRIWDEVRTDTEISATMNQIIPGNEQGLVDEEGSLGLLAYWNFNEGQGTIVSDLTPNGASGNLLNYQSIDLNGLELVTNWDGDDIPLDVEFFVHDFDPNGRNISLDPSNTSVDRVDFTDISQIAVSGFVKFSETDCFAPNVELKINGNSLVPPVFTDEAGKFILELEPGTSSAFLSAEFEDFDMSPAFIELPTLVRPIAGLSFESTTKRKLVGKVVGGECVLPIGGGTVTLRANDGCYEETVTISEVDGSYEFSSVPPVAYNVSVAHEDLAVIGPYFDALGGQEVDLTNVETDTIDFVYYSPTRVSVEILNAEVNSCGVAIDGETEPAVLLNQNHEYDVKIVLIQEYNGSECKISTGTAYINDGISVFSPKDTIAIENYSGTYTITAGAPNVAAPYTKQITVTGEDTEGNQAVTSQAVIVLGFKTLTSTFETTTPEIPFLILRDPPGDGSYAYLEESSTICNTFSFEELDGIEGSTTDAISMGFDTEFSVGLGYQQVTEIDVSADMSFNNSFSNEYGMQFEQEVCLTSTSIFSTSTDAFVTGAEGDLFVGGALNVLIGTNRLLELNSNECTLGVRDEVALSPASFSTTYLYTQAFIKNQVIPDLRELGKDESANQWERILQYNKDLKTGAVFDENLSFSAGSNLERFSIKEQTSSETISLSESFVDEVTGNTGLEVNGVGFSLGFSDATTGGYNRSETTSENITKKVGYQLSDDDPEDNFTIDVKTDAVGMPVFITLAGESSCPWEPETQTRAEVQLTPISETSVVNIPEDEVAVFQFNLGNVAETKEAGYYEIRVIQESNPNGAKISINGVRVEESISLYVEGGQSETITVTVEKGPEAFVYNDLVIEAFVECELDKAYALGFDIDDFITESEADLVPQFFDREKISVEFTKTCGRVEIQTPEEGWVINSNANNTRSIVISGYDLGLTELEDIRFQYREKADGNPYINAETLLNDDSAPDIWSFDWDVSALSDGIYQLRAVSQCSGDFLPGISEVVEGNIDREAPTVLGTPTPADAVLSANDAITIQFDEDLNCDEIISLAVPVSMEAGSINNVALFNTELDVAIEAVVTCNGNELFIVPDIQNKFIEDKVLRVDLLGLKDQYGNSQTEAISWEFLVNRNPLDWVGGDIQSVVGEGDEVTFKRQIKNNGAFDVDVNLSGALDVETLEETLLPSWLSASPLSFTLPPGGSQTVTFTVSDQLGGGSYKDVVSAATSFGAPELNFDVRVLCPEPIWELDATDFENSINFVGQLDIKGELSTDEYDQVAAFVNGELRGVGKVQYAPELSSIPEEHPYLIFMTIYTNTAMNENVVFQVWDASSCQLFGQIEESYQTDFNVASLGTPTSPMSVTVTSNVVQQLALSDGWNWISLNLNSSSTATNDQLSSLSNSERGDIIKLQDEFSQFVPGLGWVGTLNTLDVTSAYRIKLNNPDTLQLVGVPV